jgi:hypothetical protein
MNVIGKGTVWHLQSKMLYRVRFKRSDVNMQKNRALLHSTLRRSHTFSCSTFPMLMRGSTE